MIATWSVNGYVSFWQFSMPRWGRGRMPRFGGGEERRSTSCPPPKCQGAPAGISRPGRHRTRPPDGRGCAAAGLPVPPRKRWGAPGTRTISGTAEFGVPAGRLVAASLALLWGSVSAPEPDTLGCHSATREIGTGARKSQHDPRSLEAFVRFRSRCRSSSQPVSAIPRSSSAR